MRLILFFTPQDYPTSNNSRTLEKPIIHRYQEIEAFPQTLNNSQMWNWSTRLFLQEARTNLTNEISQGLPSKWTKDELDNLERTLRDHERWLSEWVEKQKNVKPNEDPVIETREMKARAKVLEQQLQKLWKRKVPKSKPATKPSEGSPTTTNTSSETETPHPPVDGAGADDGFHEQTVEGGDEGRQQAPLKGRIEDDL